MGNRYTLRPTLDHPERMDIIDPDGKPICWIPAAASEALWDVYRGIWMADQIMATVFMEGYLFGVHHAMTYGNQIPSVHVEQAEGVLSFRMMGEG